MVMRKVHLLLSTELSYLALQAVGIQSLQLMLTLTASPHVWLFQHCSTIKYTPVTAYTTPYS